MLLIGYVPPPPPPHRLFRDKGALIDKLSLTPHQHYILTTKQNRQNFTQEIPILRTGVVGYWYCSTMLVKLMDRIIFILHTIDVLPVPSLAQITSLFASSRMRISCAPEPVPITCVGFPTAALWKFIKTVINTVPTFHSSTGFLALKVV